MTQTGVIERPFAIAVPLGGQSPRPRERPQQGLQAESDIRDLLPMSVPMAPEPSGQNTPKRTSKMASSQSLNHLLNFTLPPRQTHSQSLPRRGKKSTAHGVWNKESEYHSYQSSCLAPNGFSSRICECPIPIHHESNGRLHSPLRGSRHVCSLHSYVSLFSEPPSAKVSSSGKIYYRLSSRERQPMHRQQMGRLWVQMRA